MPLDPAPVYFPGNCAVWHERATAQLTAGCDARDMLGPDLQNKIVLRGERYTAVVIGPGQENYPQLLDQICPDETHQGRTDLFRYLTDLLPCLLEGWSTAHV